MKSDPRRDPLKRLVGTWTTEATHPAMPGVVVHGTAVAEWLEGERLLILRARNRSPRIPRIDTAWLPADRSRILATIHQYVRQ